MITPSPRRHPGDERPLQRLLLDTAGRRPALNIVTKSGTNNTIASGLLVRPGSWQAKTFSHQRLLRALGRHLHHATTLRAVIRSTFR